MSQAVILVGGLGTRLRSALPDLPKPMAPVRGRPFLEYVIHQLAGFGVQNIVLCVGYKLQAIEDYFGDGSHFGVSIEYSREHELLGTAGAVKLAEPLIQSDNFLLLNGDCYCEFDGHALIEFHQSQHAAATIVATHVEDRSRFGSLKIDDGNRVLGFEEKGAATGAGFINAGIYVLNKQVLDLIPAGQRYSLEQQVFPVLSGSRLYAFKANGLFIDIGLPEEWQRAQDLLPATIRL